MSLRFLPNALTLLRMLLVGPLAWLLAQARYEPALFTLAVAAVTDGLDGFLAKRFGWTSELGKVLDPLADKLLLVTLFITLSIIGLVPVWLAVLVVLRDVVIASGAIGYRLLLGPIEGHPTKLSKLNTGCQIVYLLLVVAAAYRQAVPAEILALLGIVVAATTVVSGAEYVVTYAARAAAASRQRRSLS